MTRNRKDEMSETETFKSQEYAYSLFYGLGVTGFKLDLVLIEKENKNAFKAKKNKCFYLQ